MSEEPTSKSHAMASSFLIPAIPLLYLLSVPPILYLHGYPAKGLPVWVRMYVRPWDGFYQSLPEPLKKPLFLYDYWCYRHIPEAGP